MAVKNRFVFAPMYSCSATKDGWVTEQNKIWYQERVRGGAGLVTVEEVCVDAPVGKAGGWQLCIDDDKYISGLGELASIIQKHGVKAAIQLDHAGSTAATKHTGCQPVASSAVPIPGGEIPRELSIAEIETIVGKFTLAAKRALKAGFDGIELKCCHGNLPTGFLSPRANKRTDVYGGSLENRAKLILDIVAAVRSEVGDNYPVWVRLTAHEFQSDSGINLAEAQPVARWLDEAGVVALSVSADYFRSNYLMALPVAGERLPRPPMAHPPGFLIPLAAEIKKVVSVPVMAVGRMNLETGERALREGKIDMVIMARPLLADPEIPNKVASGRVDEIRPCIGCLICREQIAINNELRCAVNAAAGRGLDASITPATVKKRVVVVGGGPAGLEATRVAALKGHEVILFERGNRLGGQLLLAACPPYKGVLAELVDYFEAQITRLGVRVELGKEATPEMILKTKPDVVVIATGVIRSVHQIPGMAEAKTVEAADVLTGKVEAGGNVVIIGGGVTGGETAEFLALEGKNITIVEMIDEIATGMEAKHRQYLLERLNLLGVSILTGTKAEEVEPGCLVVSTESGSRQRISADTIIMATGVTPDQRLYQELSGKVVEIYLAGDCVQPRRIFEAIHEGFLVGLAI